MGGEALTDPHIARFTNRSNMGSVRRTDDALFAAIVGRDNELTRLFMLLDALPGEGAALLLRGGPGVGKTTLLDAVETRALRDDLPVARVRAVPTEQQLPLAGLHTLLRPALTRLHRLAEGHRRSIELAFALRADGDAPPPFVLALAVLELITEVAADNCLVLIVDDAHWLDDASAEILAFVGRRLGPEPVNLFVATRDPGNAEGSGAAAELDLAPLSPFDARVLLARAAPGLDPESAALVLSQADGNPLALLELPSVVRSGGGDRPKLALTRRLEEGFASAYRALPEPTQAVLLAMALQARGRPDDADVVAGRVLDARVEAADRAPGVRAGLLQRGRSSSSATRWCGRRSRDRRIQGRCARSTPAWAEVLDDEPALRAWHRALASTGPDEQTARELDAVAAEARRRGAYATAMRYAEQAGALSIDARHRRDRLIRAGYDAYELGRADDVRRLIAASRESRLDPDQADRIALLEGLFDDGVPRDLDGVRSLVRAADAARLDSNIDLAVLLLMGAARRCWWADLGTVGDEVVAILDQLDLDRDDPRLLNVLAHAAPLGRGRDVLAGLDRWATRPPTDATAAAWLASAAFNLADFERALLFGNRAVDTVRAQGRLSMLAQLQVTRCWAALFVGQWGAAYTAGDEAHRLALETHQPVWAAHARLGQADLAGRRGDSSTALELLADAERLAVVADRASVLGGVEFTRGIIELGRGRPEMAIEHLGHITDPGDRAYHSVERLWLLDYLAEAAAYAGQAAEYRPIISAAARTFAGVLSPGYAQAALLAQLLLAEPDEFDDRLAAADSPPGRTSIWYRARVDLARGMSLRRRRQVAASRRPLSSALATFETIGAQAWAQRAQTELAAAGAGPPSAGRPPWAQLSAQELQIAQLAALGLTNREIGARLYLSHRTVGSHLYRLFPKLGVTTRSQLHRALPDSFG